MLQLKGQGQEDRLLALSVAHDFFQKIGMLQTILAFEAQIWIRGAVTIGDLHIDGERNILVGPAFVRAHSLESIADYPRVIVDPLICKHFDLLPNRFVAQMNPKDGRTLIGPKSEMRWGGAVWSNDAIQVDWFRAAASRDNLKVEPFFEDLRERMTIDQSIFQKSIKLLGYLRASLSDSPEDLDQKTREKLDKYLKAFGV